MKKKLVSVVIITKDRPRDLKQCVESYLEQSYKLLEIIVVDDGSRPSVSTWLPKKYPTVKLATNKRSLGAAQARNRGLAAAKGDYILFTDDDAIGHKDIVKHLIWVFEKKKKAGIVQPLVYDKQKRNLLQGAGHDIDLTTARIKASGVREIDKGQYEGLREVPMCGCVWMVKREVFEKIGNYDPTYFIPYEDSDFSLRARGAGFKLYCYSKAKTWHQGPKKTYVHPWVEWLGITSPDRAYRVSRNKIIFMSKNADFSQFLFFILFLNPLYNFLHTIIIASSGRFDVLGSYWKGLFSGVLWHFSRVYERAIIFLLAWTDPLCWVTTKNPDSILDLGCGQGKPMQMMKMRSGVGRSVGVDVYGPSLEECRRKGIYDKVIAGDVRKISFKENSFEVVWAIQVLEHLEKEEALSLIEKMEKIAVRQVVISTPVGKIESPPEQGNVYQEHKSYFLPRELEKRGYKTIKYGWRWLLAPSGIAMKAKSRFFRKFFYLLNFLATPVYYLWQSSCDYSFTAYKNIDES